MVRAKEKHSQLRRLMRIGSFSGMSAPYKHIWQFFQALLNNHAALGLPPCFINGDLKWLSSLLALKGCTSHHPCSRCLIMKSQVEMLSACMGMDFTARTPEHPQGRYEPQVREPLLLVQPEQIVPPVLHIWLGICNAIIKYVFEECCGRRFFKRRKKKVKTMHESGGGVSDVFEFIGNELDAWLKKSVADEFIPRMATAAVANNLRTLTRWMRELQHYLLNKKRWEEEEITSFEKLVNEIQSQWAIRVGHQTTVKVHWLTHCIEFMRTHRFLGRFSESALESVHGKVRLMQQGNHANTANHRDEQARRCLADFSVRKVTEHRKRAGK
jgi:hypothetical protein